MKSNEWWKRKFRRKITIKFSMIPQRQNRLTCNMILKCCLIQMRITIERNLKRNANSQLASLSDQTNAQSSPYSSSQWSWQSSLSAHSSCLKLIEIWSKWEICNRFQPIKLKTRNFIKMLTRDETFSSNSWKTVYVMTILWLKTKTISTLIL